MALTKEQVLAVLEKVTSPDGIPLPKTGTLSEIVAGDGKVFFSITVDATHVKSWELGAKARRGCGAGAAGRHLRIGGADRRA